MMKTAFSGITPTLVVDTSFIQNESQVIKEIRVADDWRPARSRHRRAGPSRASAARPEKRVWDINTPGVCLSMVCDWFQKCDKLHYGVSQLSELKTGLGYSLAQTAYVRNAFDANEVFDEKWDTRELRFIGSHDLDIRIHDKPDRDFYRSKQRGAQTALHIATKLSRTLSNYIIMVGGMNGGHALGYNASLNQLMDPNIGILGFATSQTDFAKWLAEFLPANYPGFINRGYELVKLNRKGH